MDSDHGQPTWIKDHCYGGWIKPAAECARPYNKHWPMKQGLQLMRKASDPTRCSPVERCVVGCFWQPSTESEATSASFGRHAICTTPTGPIEILVEAVSATAQSSQRSAGSQSSDVFVGVCPTHTACVRQRCIVCVCLAFSVASGFSLAIADQETCNSLKLIVTNRHTFKFLRILHGGRCVGGRQVGHPFPRRMVATMDDVFEGLELILPISCFADVAPDLDVMQQSTDLSNK